VTGRLLGHFAHDAVRHSATLLHVGQVRLDARQCDAQVFQPRPVALQKLDGVGDLLGSGVHPKALQERLGHASAAFTMNVYAHLLPGVQEEAVASLEALLQRAESKPESTDD
jgi:hypothetical protein